MAQQKSDVLILGGGPAGRVIVHVLHRSPRPPSVVLIKDEPRNVNRCAVPYGIDPETVLDRYVIPNEIVTDFGAELRIDRVTRIDPEAHEVLTRSGDVFGYGQLVLALGARPILPPLPGIDRPNVLAVRSLEDLQLLREHAATGRRAVILGGGYIGVEVAVELRRLGLDVHLVEMLPSILSKTFEPDFVPPITQTLLENGIQLHLGQAVTGFDTDGERATQARLQDGSVIAADFFVVAVGVRPNIELAAEAGIETTPFGIVVDEQLRTSAADVFAVGDCAAKRSLVSGQPVRGEFGTNAVFMARVAGMNLLGKELAFPGVVNASASTAFDWSFGAAGLLEADAVQAGFDVVTGRSEVLDKYPMMPGVAPIRTKLVFDARTRRLLGGAVLRRGHATAVQIDLLSLALQMRATLDDLLVLQYATHPELAARPSDHSIVFAARDAHDRLRR